MGVTIADNQSVALKEKIKKYFWKTKPFMDVGCCPTKDVLAATTDKWSMFVLFNLGYSNTLRFNQLKEKINGISARMLTVTLKKLESNGLIERKVFAEVPPRVEYSLTEFGAQFSERLVDFGDWFLDQYQTPPT
ncbi:MAG: helix-turn-helix domain-containing protein [Bacteroidota bacterium]